MNKNVKMIFAYIRVEDVIMQILFFESKVIISNNYLIKLQIALSEESVALSFQGIKKAGKKGFLKLGEYNMTSAKEKTPTTY